MQYLDELCQSEWLQAGHLYIEDYFLKKFVLSKEKSFGWFLVVCALRVVIMLCTSSIALFFYYYEMIFLFL